MKSIPLASIQTHKARAAPPADARMHPRWLLAAPHRLGFFAAAWMLGTTALWWAVVLLAGAAGHAPPAWAVPPPVAHALLMGLGFMPLFIVGFLFTAGPRWLGQPDVHARSLLAPVLLMGLGWALVLPGVHLQATVAGAGMALVACGWSALCWRFITILRASRVPDRTHSKLVAMSCSIGAVAMWVATWALLSGEVTTLRAATQVALWGFIAPVFAAVSHRMIPFFSASALPVLDAWRPMWLQWVMLGVVWLEAPIAVAQLWRWPLPGALLWAMSAIELPAAVLLLWLAVRWGLVQSLKIRLLAMLHGGFVWLGLSFALAGVSHAMLAFSDGTRSLGLAPMHALTMGYLGATMFAMTTRVSSGHSGRALAADNPAWTLYWVLQVAVVLRVAAALWPAATTPLVALAITAWAVATVGWAVRYGRWFVKPRVDGRPG